MLRKLSKVAFYQASLPLQHSQLVHRLNLNSDNKLGQNLMFQGQANRRLFSSHIDDQSDSIFKQADYFPQGESLNTETISQAASSVKEIPYFDSNDTIATFMSVLPKDSSNLIQGVSTYGFWEYVAYLDDTFYGMWITAAENLGMGMGLGLITTSLLTKAVFTPIIIYSQSIGVKMKLLQPDQEEIIANMKRYSQQGNREAAKIERQKMKFLRRQHGVYPLISMLNVFQMPVHLVYISMINRLSFNYDLCPNILTDGFLWFRDLSAPDPYGILPMIGGLISLLNILSTSTTSMTPTMRKIRRYVYFLPLISVPIWMTFPAAFNLYWISSSLIHLVILNLFRNVKFRSFIGIPEYLPGTKLERLNMKQSVEVIKPKIFTSQPSTKDKAIKAQQES